MGLPYDGPSHWFHALAAEDGNFCKLSARVEGLPALLQGGDSTSTVEELAIAQRSVPRTQPHGSVPCMP